jgi:hypothetical protein
MVSAKVTAREILDEYKAALSRGPDFRDLARGQAGESRYLLERILSDTEFRKTVARTRRPWDLSFPEWAREVAWILWNPEGRISSPTRESIYKICSSLLREATDAPHRRVVTGELIRNETIRFLTAIARDLSGLESKSDEQPLRLGK